MLTTQFSYLAEFNSGLTLNSQKLVRSNAVAFSHSLVSEK